MKTIALYVTDSGFGHITRTLALIEQILEHSEHHIYLASGDVQVDYAKVYLSNYVGRISYKSINTAAGTCIKEKSFEIDIPATVDKIKTFLSSVDETVKNEVNSLKKFEVALIISDISIIGALVAKEKGVKSVGITNYTYYHRYIKLGIDQQLIKPFIEAYNLFDEFFEYAYADDMTDITCKKTSVGLVAREVNELAVADLKSKYWPSAYLSIGQIADRDKIKINFNGGTIYATGSLMIEGNAHVIKLPSRVSRSQDYINASSLALIKPGWSQVAECLIAGIPFGIIEANKIEDGEISAKLLSEGLCFELKEEDADYLNIKKLNMKAAGTRVEKVPNDALNIVNKLMELMA